MDEKLKNFKTIFTKVAFIYKMSNITKSYSYYFLCYHLFRMYYFPRLKAVNMLHFSCKVVCYLLYIFINYSLCKVINLSRSNYASNTECFAFNFSNV